jgi:RNA polymerase sigma-70 factor (ECF subfamily)
MTTTTAGHDELLALYDRAMPEVYGYLVRRCDSPATAEDLTADTFMAAVRALQADAGKRIEIGWLIVTARHKLIDHWRRGGRQRDALAALWDDVPVVDDPFDTPIDVEVARLTLAALAPIHRSVLTLRYCDGLPVGEVAEAIGRTIHATEALLTRAKAAFRTHHRTEFDDDAPAREAQ